MGCEATPHSPAVGRAIVGYYNGQYESAFQTLLPLAEKTDEDYVLNNVRLGSVALADYDLERAEAAFYKAYEVMNSVKVNDPGRKTAAVLFSEKAKVWKGEPFERAMANFYLGLVYSMREDHANARAAYENALFKLRDYGNGKNEQEEYTEQESNFIIAYVMLGRSWQRLGEERKAEDIFAQAAKLRPDLSRLTDPSVHQRSNVLLVVDFAHGPQKVLQGDNSVVAFAPHPRNADAIPRPRVRVDAEMINLRGLTSPPDDLLEMAQDRRWQDIDTIRLTKSVIGTGMMGVGAYQGAKRKPDYGSAAALLAAGALLKATATGDVRHWETLPRTTFLIPLKLTPGRHDVNVSFGESSSFSQTWKGIEAPQEGDRIYYFRVTRGNAGPHLWPPPNYRAPEAR
jgi:tetratricopeptide (TPR) repeat protein